MLQSHLSAINNPKSIVNDHCESSNIFFFFSLLYGLVLILFGSFNNFLCLIFMKICPVGRKVKVYFSNLEVMLSRGSSQSTTFHLFESSYEHLIVLGLP